MTNSSPNPFDPTIANYSRLVQERRSLQTTLSLIMEQELRMQRNGDNRELKHCLDAKDAVWGELRLVKKQLEKCEKRIMYMFEDHKPRDIKEYASDSYSY